ncbi:MAG: hypothetical protein ABI592_14050 [Acidobacteriota bacterium]
MPGQREEARRALVGLFLFAFGIRCGATFLFDRIGAAVGDPFAGSSDAWAYDQWARRLAEAWPRGIWLSLERWNQAGRWDVGFHYVLGAVYWLFGESVVLGRAVVALFGALAVVLFFPVARRVLGPRSAQIAAIAYAVWPTSVAWNGYSVLRDSLVWTLLMLCVWLALLVWEARWVAILPLGLSLVALRLTRPYAFAAVTIGLLLAAAAALGKGWRAGWRPVAAWAAALLGTELLVVVLGFPSLPRMTGRYASKRVILQDVDRSPAAAGQALVYPGSGLSPLHVPHEEPDGFVAPKRLFGPSLPANAARFLINPPAWAPVEGDIRTSDNWQLPGMWIWYLILPLCVAGFAAGLARRGPGRIVFAGTLIFVFFLVVAGRGDFARQREMVVPVFLLAAAIGAEIALARPRRMASVYAVYLVLFVAGIAYHRHTLRERGLVGSRPPAVSGQYEEVC